MYHAIGKRFRSTDLKNAWLEVVGVVQDGKQSGLFADPAGYFYVPIAQAYMSQRVLQLRTAGDAGALAPLVAREIRALDPDLPVFDVTTMERMILGVMALAASYVPAFRATRIDPAVALRGDSFIKENYLRGLCNSAGFA